MPSKLFSHYLPTPRFLKFSYVGFELNPQGFYYSEVLHEGRGLKLGKHGMHKIEAAETDPLSNEAIRSALKEVARKEKIDHIKCTLPEEKTYLFTTEVSGTTDEEIKSSIEFQLEENVPLTGPEALFEFYLLPEVSGQKRQAVVSVVGVDTVLEYTSFFESVGLTPVSFMAESSSVSRSIIPKGDTNTYMMVYFSESKTVCSIVSKGFVQFTSTISSGVGLITSALEKFYNLPKSEAEKMKTKEGLQFGDGKTEHFSVMANAVSVLQDEIQRVLIYWHTHRIKTSADDVKKIIVCGKDAGLSGLREYLSVSLKREVAVADVWVNMPRYKDEVPPIHYSESLLYAGSLGLSLQ